MAPTLMRLVHASDRTRHWTRWPDWLDSKLAWAGTAWYYLALTHGWSLAHTLSVVARVLPFIACLAALGYTANDYWDRAADVTAGKRDVGATPGPSGHRWLVAGLLGVTALATVPLATSGPGLVTGLALVGLALAYSAPPLRLKTRGALGVAAGALAQWGTPPLSLLVGGATLTRGFLVLCALGLSAGLRWMLLHQVQDVAGDARAGLRTFTARHGTGRAMRILGALVGIEAGLIVTWIVLDGRAVPTLAVVSTVYLAAYALVARRFARAGRLRDLLGSYERAPFRGLYLAWLPLGFLAAHVPVEPAFAWLVPIELWWRRHQVVADLRLGWHAVRLPDSRPR